MAIDMNYIMFNQHLFHEYNELEASIKDHWFNSSALDILSQDYTHAIGTDYKHTFAVVSAT